ncbi:MAG: isoprenyl transferase [Sphingomonadales bacterium]|nr:isoprenyl transferase [Sphingomonadales bacterium]
MTDTAPLIPPRHIAIIMDGNGRWAKQRNLPHAAGHKAGAEAVRRSVQGCLNEGVDYLTLYAFSSENWKRPADEVDALMGLLRLYIKQEIKKLHKNGVRVRFIGDRNGLANDIIKLIEDAEDLTSGNTRLVMTLALNYGARAEIVAATRQIAEEVAAGDYRVGQVDEELFSTKLETAGMPDPDLIIRTSGEQRISNFLLWQIAYSEFLFLETYWPDFDEAVLKSAIDQYHDRDRRYGGR